jgi:hypothetical protein
MRVSYTWWTRVRVVPQAALLALLEMVYSVVVGRFRQARDVGSAWLWNSRHRGGIRRQRQALSKIRRVPDREVRNLLQHDHQGLQRCAGPAGLWQSTSDWTSGPSG